MCLSKSIYHLSIHLASQLPRQRKRRLLLYALVLLQSRGETRMSSTDVFHLFFNPSLFSVDLSHHGRTCPVVPIQPWQLIHIKNVDGGLMQDCMGQLLRGKTRMEASNLHGSIFCVLERLRGSSCGYGRMSYFLSSLLPFFLRSFLPSFLPSTICMYIGHMGMLCLHLGPKLHGNGGIITFIITFISKKMARR